MSCIEKFTTACQTVFSVYGRLVGKHPWWFIIGCILVNGGLGVLLLGIQSVNNVEEVYVPIGNQAAKDRHRARAMFPDKSGTSFYPQHVTDDGKFGEVIFTSSNGSNILTDLVIAEMVEINQMIKTVSFNDSDGSRVDFQTTCARLLGSCVVSGEFILGNEFLSDLVNNSVSYPDYKNGGQTVDLSFYLSGVSHVNGTLNGANYLKLRYNLRQDSPQNNVLSGLWEEEFLSEMAKKHHSTKVIDLSYAVSDSLNVELTENTGGDIRWFSLTFTLMITYASIVTSGGNCVSTKGFLSMAGVLAAGLGILAGFGVASRILPFSNIVGIMPFLVIGVGVDDAFILMSGWSETWESATIPDRVAATMKTSGMSITLTSLTDLVAFLIGITSSFYSVKIFCLYTALAILFCYLNQITLFAGCLAVHGRRVEENRHCATCMVVKSADEIRNRKHTESRGDLPAASVNPHQSKNNMTNGNHEREPTFQHNVSNKNNVDPTSSEINISSGTLCLRLCFCSGQPSQAPGDDENCFERAPRRLLPAFVLSIPGKVAIVVMFLGYLSMSIYGVIYLRQGLDLKNLIAPSSYFYEYTNWNTDHYQQRFLITFFVSQPLDYNETKNVNSLEKIFHEVKADSAIQDDFLISWLTTYQNSSFYNQTTENHFLAGLKNFLQYYPVFENDIRFGDNSSTIIGSRFHFQTVDLPDSSQQGQFMIRMRDIASRSSISVFVYSPPFLYFEQYNAILSNTLQTVGVAVAAMFVLSVIFVPHPLMFVSITVCMVSTLTGILGFLYWWDLTLSSITMLHLVTATGFSVDYSAHICHAVMQNRNVGTNRHDVVSKALASTGGPILNGALSSFIGILFLMPSESYIFSSFFKVMLLVLLFGIAHSILFLPVFFSLFGPARKPASDDGPSGVVENTSSDFRDIPKTAYRNTAFGNTDECLRRSRGYDSNPVESSISCHAGNSNQISPVNCDDSSPINTELWYDPGAEHKIEALIVQHK